MLLQPLFLMFFLFILGKAAVFGEWYHKKKETDVVGDLMDFQEFPGVGDLMEVQEFQKICQKSNKKNKLYRIPKYNFMHQIVPYIISKPSVYAERILKQIFGDEEIYAQHKQHFWRRIHKMESMPSILRFSMNSCEYQSKKQIVIQFDNYYWNQPVLIPKCLLNVSKHIQCAQIKIEFPMRCLFHFKTENHIEFRPTLHFNFVRTKGWVVQIGGHKVNDPNAWNWYPEFQSNVKLNITATFEKLEFVKA